MEYRPMGRTGLRVSELCLGAMTFGWSCDEATSHDILAAFVDAGGNFIDTADVYSRWYPGNQGGESETILGTWLAGRSGPRDSLVIATKVRGAMGPGPNDQGLGRKHVAAAVEASLRRLQTDYIDLYQMHSPDDRTPIEETLSAFDDLVHQGKVRYVGVSNFPAWQLGRALWASDAHGWARPDCLQPHYNLVWRAEFERELQPQCATFGIGVIPYSPLAGGFLTGKYQADQAIPPHTRGETSQRVKSYMTPQGYAVIDRLEALGQAHGKSIAQTALAWLLSNPVVTAPIIGANSVAQLQDSLGAVGYRLSAEEKQALDEATAWQP